MPYDKTWFSRYDTMVAEAGDLEEVKGYLLTPFEKNLEVWRQLWRVIERAQLTAAREELALSFTKVSAPFAGVVATRNVRAGDTVSTAAAAFVLTDPDALRCVVPRPQRELEFFQAAREEGGTVEIRVVPEAYPEHEYAGSIEIVSPTIDTDSGSFRLTIGLAQPAADIRAALRLAK